MHIKKSYTKENIIEIIKFISLITDDWTSTAITDSYLAFIVKYKLIDDSWKFCRLKQFNNATNMWCNYLMINIFTQVVVLLIHYVKLAVKKCLDLST